MGGLYAQKFGAVNLSAAVTGLVLTSSFSQHDLVGQLSAPLSITQVRIFRFITIYPDL